MWDRRRREREREREGKRNTIWLISMGGAGLQRTTENGTVLWSRGRG